MVTCTYLFFFFFQAEDGIRDADVTGVQTCALPISPSRSACATRPCSRPPAIWSVTRLRAAVSMASSRTRISTVLPLRETPPWRMLDRKSVVEGKSVDLGGRRIIKKKKTTAVGGETR